MWLWSTLKNKVRRRNKDPPSSSRSIFRSPITLKVGLSSYRLDEDEGKWVEIKKTTSGGSDYLDKKITEIEAKNNLIRVKNEVLMNMIAEKRLVMHQMQTEIEELREALYAKIDHVDGKNKNKKRSGPKKKKNRKLF